jgi:tetratricopeptide (TPR) repeat protein
LAAVAFVYFNALSAPFVFDDIRSIPENASIRQLNTAALTPPPGLTVSGRPVVNLSLAVNYAVDRLDPRGYHVFNNGLHALAACVLFGVLRFTFGAARLRGRFGGNEAWLAFGAALFWALHPLQTEAVTYVIQRTESLMAFFYLLTLYAFIRATHSSRPRAWRVLCVVACALGMGCKEVMVSAPLMVLAYDGIFVSGSLRESWRRHRGLYFGLAGTWLILILLLTQSGNRAGTAGFSSGVTPWEYAVAQCRAIIHYLRLSVWPSPLVFDYGPYMPAKAGEAVPYAIALLLAGAASVLALRRNPAAGFACLFFFAVLAPTSSVLPIATEVMAERRMYLPLAALAALAAAGSFVLAGKRGMIALLAVAAGLGALTVQRNRVYRSERSLWEETVKVAPANPRAHCWYGTVVAASGDMAAAESHFRAALALRPDYIIARERLGDCLFDQGKTDEATREYQEILRREPGDLLAHNQLGSIALNRGEWEDAVRHFEAALALAPHTLALRNNAGLAHFRLGHWKEAGSEYEAVLRVDPQNGDAWYGLGNVQASVQDWAAARLSYEQAIRWRPNVPEIRANLGGVLEVLGLRGEAARRYREALVLRPDYPLARERLAALANAAEGSP